MTPVIFGKYEIGLFTDDGRYLSYGAKYEPGTVLVKTANGYAFPEGACWDEMWWVPE